MSSSQYVELGQNCYEVEQIRDRKIKKGVKFYLIKWKNWEQKFNTWEPEQNLLTCLEMTKEFDKQYDKRNSPSIVSNTDVTKKKSTEPSEIEKKTKPIQKDKQKVKQPKRKDKKSSDSSSQFSLSKQSSQPKKKKQPKMLKIEKQKTKVRPQEPQKIQNLSFTQQQSKIKKTLSEQESKPMIQNNGEDDIEYTRINYYTYAVQNGLKKLFYNVNVQSRKSKRFLPVRDIDSQILCRYNSELIVKFLQDYIKEMQKYEREERLYQQQVGHLK